MSVNINTIFSPTDADLAYMQDDQLRISLICRMDSYKFSHPFAYPDEEEDVEIEGMTSYGQARVGRDQVIIPAGMQMLVKRYLTQRITMADIDLAEAFTVAHFGRKLFARDAYEHVVNEYDGALPLIIRTIPEGTPVHGGLPLYSTTCLDRKVHWMSAAFETLIQRGIWYPTTIASLDYATKLALKRFYEISGADMGMLPFALHDFGARGATCGEQAEIGGAAHLFNFMGSDTVEGVIAANFYYKEPMSGYSVYATEHSVQCSFGGGTEDAIRYIRHQLKRVKELGLPYCSIVLDGYDVYREAEICCTVLHQDILDCGAKVVFRPDSGDMMEVVPRILRLQEAAFGYDPTSTGYKKIRNVGIIQGDGVDRLTMLTLIGNILAMGYSADCVIFGSGGALLQKVNRDTFKFAQKCSAILVDGAWKGIAKNPVTDPGKKSMEGVLTTVRSKMTGELMAARLDDGPLDSDFEDLMVLVYHTGQLYNETTLVEIRARCAV